VEVVVGAAPEEWWTIYDRMTSQSRHSVKVQSPQRTAASRQSAQARQARLNGSNRCLAVTQPDEAKDRSGWRIQPIDATHSLNISAGVRKPSVLRGLSFNCRAIALS
jgi:hypothetical protein